jgi:hypothetical protein
VPALSDYANVDDTALALLGEKGFQVWRDEAAELYCAERDGWDFMAPSPVALLGLISIFERVGPSEYQEYWWLNRAAAGAHTRVPSSPPREYVPVWGKKA